MRDARDHGGEVRPVCISASHWDCTLEPLADGRRFAVRLGLRMVKGLANAHAAAIVLGRADQPFTSVEDLWRRVRVPVAALTHIAEADGFRPALRLGRREALWHLKGLADEDLPLLAAAEARAGPPEFTEPTVALRPMAAGREVVEDYGHTGLSPRRHPVAFLREDLTRRRMIPCAEAMAARNRLRCEVAAIVLIRQRPGSVKGVMFITIEDETGIANLVVWPKVFETNRRTIMGAGMIAVAGQVQREGEVVHLVAHRITELSADLASIGKCGDAFPLTHGRGDEFRASTRTLPGNAGPPTPRDIYIPDLHIDMVRVKTKNFR